MRNFLCTICITAVIATLLSACEKTENGMVTDEELNHKTCTQNSDCLPVGYCGEKGFCQSDCRTDADCYMMNPDYICLDYRCVDPEAIIDGDGEDDAEALGEGEFIVGAPCKYWSPEDAGEKNLPENYGDKDCTTYGWQWTCNSDNNCISNGSVDYGVVDETKNPAAWTGIWAGVYTTAATTTGMPEIIGDQHSVSEHNLLLRFSQDGDNLIIDGKVCRIYIWPFRGDELFTDGGGMVTPATYYNNIVMQKNIVENIAELAKGATFTSSSHLETRGVVLDDATCECDSEGNLIIGEDDRPLSCVEDLPNLVSYEADPDAFRVWDQDEDGKLAMTTYMEGVLTGEVYSVQRYMFWYEGQVLDRDHLKGYLRTYAEQYVLDASLPLLKQDTKSVPYNYDLLDGEGALHDRNYFRFMRVDESWDCEDVIAEAQKPDSFIRFTLHRDEVCLTDDDCQERTPGYICQDTKCINPETEKK